MKVARKLKLQNGVLPLVNAKVGHGLHAHVVSEVISFYEDDAISRQCPGKKDCITVVDEQGLKIQRQKRLVLCNLREVYRHFKIEHPEIKVGFSKFAELRPKWCILAGSSGTHAVCVCTIHQNVKLMLAGANYPASCDDLIKKIVCDVNNQRCMFGECSNCPGTADLSEEILAFFTMQYCDEVRFSQWTTTDRATLQCHVENVTDFVDLLVNQLLALKKHQFIANNQSRFLKRMKDIVLEKEVIVTGDFSENYSFVVQDEIQGFHWSTVQATIHPFVCYYRVDGELKHISVCFISNTREHLTSTVYTFQRKLISYLKEIVHGLSKVYYFSDGCSGQYKNKKNFCNLCYHSTDFGVSAEWHFFATSHGKGPCDGIGGTVKRLAAKASLQRPYSDQILTPKALYDWAVENLKSIKFFFIEHLEIEQIQNDILTERFSYIRTVPGTLSFHFFKPENVNCISTAFISSESPSFALHNFKLQKV